MFWPNWSPGEPPKVLVLVLVVDLVLDGPAVDHHQTNGPAGQGSIIAVEPLVLLVSTFCSTKTRSKSRTTTPLLESRLTRSSRLAKKRDVSSTETEADGGQSYFGLAAVF